MLENLTNLIRQNAGDTVNNNPAIPPGKNEAAIQNAGSSIISTLQNALAGGRINDVLGFFKNKGQDNHPLVHEATGNYAQNLQNQLGLDPTAAQSVANKVVPQTMNQLANKATDPNEHSFNLQNIFNQLTGGKTSNFNMQAVLNKFGDKDGDGDVDLQDLKSMFSGGGGLMGKVKGMFG